MGFYTETTGEGQSTARESHLLDPSGNRYFRAIGPLVSETHPSRGGVGDGDWLHANSIDYNAELDQIILSIPGFNEIWVIDHSTSMAEAAGYQAHIAKPVAPERLVEEVARAVRRLKIDE